MWALSTCGEPGEIKKNTHPKCITALFGEQVVNKWVYSTRAERDAALANADKIANCSGFTWCAFPVGEASMYIQAYAADYAVAYKKMYTSRAVQLRPHGGQFDSARSSARTPRAGPQYV